MGATLQRLRERLALAARVLRVLAGAPDYDRYVSHMRRHHPSVVPLGPGEFAAERLAERYSRPGSRCC